MKTIAAILAAALLAACATGHGVTTFTNPKPYLAEFPIGLSQNEVLADMGTPNERLPLNDGEAWSYIISSGIAAPIKYDFVFRNGQVYDVTYHAPGPWNGMSARELQGLPS